MIDRPGTVPHPVGELLLELERKVAVEDVCHEQPVTGVGVRSERPTSEHKAVLEHSQWHSVTQLQAVHTRGGDNLFHSNNTPSAHQVTLLRTGPIPQYCRVNVDHPHGPCASTCGTSKVYSDTQHGAVPLLCPRPRSCSGPSPFLVKTQSSPGTAPPTPTMFTRCRRGHCIPNGYHCHD